MPAIRSPIRAPEFRGGEWLNSLPVHLHAPGGRVALVDFWDMACISCLRAVPYRQAWWERYRDLGLLVVGVHTPEFAFARDGARVRDAVGRLGITYPVLLDPNAETWTAWANRYWPAAYVVGADGCLRFFHYGEGSYQHLEEAIQGALRACSPEVALPPLLAPRRPADAQGAACARTTPTIDLGFTRGRGGNLADLHPQARGVLAPPRERRCDTPYLTGCWQRDGEAVVLAGGTGLLEIRYEALEVYLVAGPAHGAAGILVSQDGAPLPDNARGADLAADGELRITTPGAYQIVRNPAFGHHDLRLEVRTPGTALYRLAFVTACITANHAEAA